jgi:hypothetical protein
MYSIDHIVRLPLGSISSSSHALKVWSKITYLVNIWLLVILWSQVGRDSMSNIIFRNITFALLPDGGMNPVLSSPICQGKDRYVPHSCASGGTHLVRVCRTSLNPPITICLPYLIFGRSTAPVPGWQTANYIFRCMRFYSVQFDRGHTVEAISTLNQC